MERKIDSNEFRKDLKDSVLGILNIKTYDSLIGYIGSEAKVTTLLGKLNSMITHSSKEEQDAKRKLDTIREKKEMTEMSVDQLKIDKKEQQRKIEETKNEQQKIQENAANLNERVTCEYAIAKIDEEIKGISKDLMRIGFNALYKKELIKVRKKYNEFVNQQEDIPKFYQFLHADTLHDILDKGICICGEPVEEGSVHEAHLKSLFKYALPNSYAQNLSFIESDIFNNTSDLTQDKINMTNLISRLDECTLEKRSWVSKLEKVELEIKVYEETIGETSQVNIENRREKLAEISKKLAVEEENLNRYLAMEKYSIAEVRPIIDKRESNRKIQHAIDELNGLLIRLIKEKEELETKGREILTKNFNENLSLVMSGNFSTDINEDYYITVTDLDRNRDITSVLSTGQNVIVSISFIRALIDTASEISKEYNKEEKYGVIMDAALSNLDEKHIRNVNKYNLNNFEQLIFISVRRLLRNEMYDSIKDNIGKVYEFVKAPKNVIINKLDENKIYDFIHEMVEE